MRFDKDPDAYKDCKRCHGTGVIEISGNICFGMGAEPKWGTCNCVMYKAIGRDAEGKKLK